MDWISDLWADIEKHSNNKGGWVLISLLLIPVAAQVFSSLFKTLGAFLVRAGQAAGLWVFRLTKSRLPKPFLRAYRIRLARLLATARTYLPGVQPVPLASIFTESAIKSGFDDSTVTLPSAVKQHAMILLLGGAGSGKTTLAQHLALRLCGARAGAEVGEQWTPVFLRLREIAASKAEILPAIAEEIRRVTAGSVDEQFVRDVLGRGEFLVVLDGLDEVPEEAGDKGRELGGWSRRDLAEKIVVFGRGLLANKKPSRLILTCRESAYSAGELRELSELRVFRIEPFSESNLREFLEGRPAQGGRRALDLLPQLLASSSLRATCSNPLLLALLTELYLKTPGHEEFRLPASKPEFFERAFEELFTHRPEERRTRQKFEKPVKRKILERVARRCCNQPATTDRESIRESWIHEEAKAVMGEDVDANAFVRELVETNGVLGRVIDRGPIQPDARYVFAHRTFLEYLAACDYAHRSTPRELVREVMAAVDLRNIPPLYCGVVENEKDVAWVVGDRLSAGDWFQAGECLEAAPIFDDEGLARRVGDGLVVMTGAGAGGQGGGRSDGELRAWSLLASLAQRKERIYGPLKASYEGAFQVVIDQAGGSEDAKPSSGGAGGATGGGSGSGLEDVLLSRIRNDSGFATFLAMLLPKCPERIGEAAVGALARRGLVEDWRSVLLALGREGTRDRVRLKAARAVDNELRRHGARILAASQTPAARPGGARDWPFEDFIPGSVIERAAETFMACEVEPESESITAAITLNEDRAARGSPGAEGEPVDRRLSERRLRDWATLRRDLRLERIFSRAVSHLGVLVAFAPLLALSLGMAVGIQKRAPVRVAWDGISVESAERLGRALELRAAAGRLRAGIEDIHSVADVSPHGGGRILKIPTWGKEVFEKFEMAEDAASDDWAIHFSREERNNLARLALDLSAALRFVKAMDRWNEVARHPLPRASLFIPPLGTFHHSRGLYLAATIVALLVSALFVVGVLTKYIWGEKLKFEETLGERLGFTGLAILVIYGAFVVWGDGSVWLRLMPGVASLALGVGILFTLALELPRNLWKKVYLELSAAGSKGEKRK